MAVLVIDDVASADDVLALARHLLDLLANDSVQTLVSPGTVTLTRGSSPVSDRDLADLVDLHDDYACTDVRHRQGCTCRYDAAHTDPRQLRVVDALRHDGPVRYVACPRRGQHLALTECWMCWSDVHRGAVVQEEVLAR